MAVCSFYLNEMEEAEKLQSMAVESLPVIEYYYNLARIYEAWGRYGDSVKYFAAVARAEENITMEDRIDSVRIKNKVIKLTKDSGSIGDFVNELMIALRLKDSREVFIIEDVDMEIKDKSFKWDIVRENGTNRLSCSYDREKYDPYNLIDSLEWTVRSGGKVIYTPAKKKVFQFSLIRTRIILYILLSIMTLTESQPVILTCREAAAYIPTEAMRLLCRRLQKQNIMNTLYMNRFLKKTS